MTTEPIRILIVGIPRLLHELIERAMGAEPDMEIVSRSDSLADFAEVAEREEPDFAIVALTDSRLPGECREFLDERARVKLFGIGPADGQATLYRLRPERVVLGEVSPQEVVAAIRAAATTKTDGPSAKESMCPHS
jgi:DNA-binding NarL/FixJ family response regulator